MLDRGILGLGLLGSLIESEVVWIIGCLSLGWLSVVFLRFGD